MNHPVLFYIWTWFNSIRTHILAWIFLPDDCFAGMVSSLKVDKYNMIALERDIISILTMYFIFSEFARLLIKFRYYYKFLYLFPHKFSIRCNWITLHTFAFKWRSNWRHDDHYVQSLKIYKNWFRVECVLSVCRSVTLCECINKQIAQHSMKHVRKLAMIIKLKNNLQTHQFKTAVGMFRNNLPFRLIQWRTLWNT